MPETTFVCDEIGPHGPHDGPGGCDGVKVYAHEEAPEPGEDAPIRDLARYHVARAQGFWVGFMEAPTTERVRTLLVVAQAQVAMLLVALYDGLSGEEAARWAFDRCQGDNTGEWLWETAVRLGLRPQYIRAYELSAR